MNALKTFRSLEPSNRHNLIILFITALGYWISMTNLLPTLPAYIEDIGGTPQQVGLVMGSFAIGLILSRSWLGQLADRRSRKLVVIIGTIVAVLSPLGYLFSDSIKTLIIIRAFHGVSIAAFTTGYSALVVDLSPVKQRGEIIGYMTLAVPIGMALGPALGGFLHEYGGYTPLFLVSAGSALISCLLATQVQEEREKLLTSATIKAQSLPSRTFWQILCDRSIFIPTLMFLTVGMIFGALTSFLPLFMRDLKVPLNTGLFYMVAAMVSFCARIFSGEASDRYGRGLFITGSLICYGISMSLLALAQTPLDFLIAAMLEGAAGGIAIPMIMALISDRSSAYERGRVFSISGGGFDIGIAISAPILGELSSFLGYRGIFTISGWLAGLGLLIFLCQSNKNISHSLRFAMGKGKDLYALELLRKQE